MLFFLLRFLPVDEDAISPLAKKHPAAHTEHSPR